MSFEEEIISLIESEKKVKKEEKDYFDCKLKWHEKKIDLLHDIICMANNLADRDAYIIIGVEDETFSVVGVDKSDKNRKNTQQLTNFLADVKFAGDNRPSVEVKTIAYDSKFIDVIVIKGSNLVPYYLSEDYPSNKSQKNEQSNENQKIDQSNENQKIEQSNKIKEKKRFLRCGNIYTRKEDSNTAIIKTADPDEIEKLWKRRFFLDKTPLKRVQLLLKDVEKWSDCPVIGMQNNIKKVKYHEDFPEYTIKIFENDNLPKTEFYFAGSMCNIACNFLICFHSTILRSFEGICDYFGRGIVAPLKFTTNFEDDNFHNLFFYYTIDNKIEYSLSTIFSQNSFDNFPLIVHFLNNDEFQEFVNKFQLKNSRESSLISNLFKSESQNKSYDNYFLNYPDQSYLRSLLIFSRCIEKKLNEFRQLKHTDIITK